MAIIKITHPLVSVKDSKGKTVHLKPGKHDVPDEVAEKLIARKLAKADSEEEVQKLEVEVEAEAEAETETETETETEKKASTKRQK
jgi:hypothetical protein